jgi:DNA-binding NarL/FixJ family response regulator
MRRDPDAAEELLLDLKADAQDAVINIRRLVYGLRPPALDDLGLLGTLRESAAQYSAKGLSVAVEAPESLPPLSAAVEVAAYRIAQEALSNISRHAEAHACTVYLAIEEAGVLCVGIHDQRPRNTRPAGERLPTRRGGPDLDARARKRARRQPRRRVASRGWHPVPRQTAFAEGGVMERSTERLRVLVADDHPVFRRGMRAMLGVEPDTELAGETMDGEEAVWLALEVRPDVILMDLNMPRATGIEATHRSLEANPDTAILTLTMFEDDKSIFAAMRAGAHGYVLKGADGAQTLRAIHAAASGEAIFSPAITQRLTEYFATSEQDHITRSDQAFPNLTEREHEILSLMAEGYTNNTIASRLYLSPKTVRNYVSSIFTKLQVSDRSQAIVHAREAGLGTRGDSSR